MSGFLTKPTASPESVSTAVPAANSIPRANESGLLDPGWTAIAETVSVGKSGCSFTSIFDALASITDASMEKPYCIRIYPGVYEENQLVLKPYVSIKGYGGVHDTVVKAKNNNEHFIIGCPASYIEKITIYGPIDENFAAIYFAPITSGEEMYVHATVIRSGYFGLWANSPSATAPYIYFIDVSASLSNYNMHQFIKLTNYGKANITRSECTSIVCNTDYGIHAVGQNTSIYVDGFSYYSPSGTGIYANSGAKIRANSITLLNGTTGVHIGPDGQTIVDMNAAAISSRDNQFFTNHIIVESPRSKVSFLGKTDREKINIVEGAQFIASFLDGYEQFPGESTTIPGQVVYGELWLGTKDAAIPLRSYTRDTLSTGWVSGGELSYGGGLAINYTAGTGYININDTVVQTKWDSGSVNAIDEVSCCVYVDVDGVVKTSSFRPNFQNVIPLGSANSINGEVVLITSHTVPIAQLAAITTNYADVVVGPISVSGCVVSVHDDDTLQLDVDSGSYFAGNDFKVAQANSAISFVYWYRSGSGGWSCNTNQTQVDAFHYDDGSGTLAEIPEGKFSKDLLFLCTNGDGAEYHLVYAQELFDSKIEAETGNNPNVPGILGTYGLRLAGIVIDETNNSIASIVDQRPKLGQFSLGTTTIARHSDLAGLSSDDHVQYQLRSEKGFASGYAGLDSESKILSTNLNLAILPPENITKSDALVGISTNIARQDHKHDITTGAAGTILIGSESSEGTATSLSRSDHVHALQAPSAPENVLKQTASSGTALTVARADHKHDVATGVPVSIGISNLEGTATSLARSDHSHSGQILQSIFSEVTVDTTTASAAFVTLLSQNINTSDGYIYVNATFSSSNATNNQTNYFRITIDDVPIRGCGTRFASATTPGAGAILIKRPIAAGAHNIQLQWRVAGGTGRIYPVTAPDAEHTSLLIQEMSI